MLSAQLREAAREGQRIRAQVLQRIVVHLYAMKVQVLRKSAGL